MKVKKQHWSKRYPKNDWLLLLLFETMDPSNDSD